MTRIPPMVMSTIAIVVASVVAFYPSHPDRLREQALVVLVGLSVLWCMQISRRLKFPLLAPGLFYMCLSGMRIFAEKIHPEMGDFTLRWPAAYGTALFILVVSYMTFTRLSTRFVLFHIFEMLALVDSVLLILGVPGVLDNPGVDATFIAMIYPSILLRDWDWFLLGRTQITGAWLFFYFIVSRILPPLAILFSHSASGVFCLAAVAIAMTLQALEHRKATLLLLAGAAMTLILGYLTQGSELFSSTGRVGMWKVFLDWICEDNLRLLFGTGLGSFEKLGNRIQQIHGSNPWDLWYYAHNEYLQVLFETGVLGVALTFTPLLLVGVLSWRRKLWVFPCLVAIAVGALAQSPLRIFLMSVWCALLVREAIGQTMPWDMRTLLSASEEAPHDA